MVKSSQIFTSLIVVNFLLVTSYGTDTDIFCLKSIKDSLEDPYNILKSWNFNNKTEGFICRFIGVECWNQIENRVLILKLSNMGLKGQFPRGIGNCSSLNGLDLSMNNLSGAIPSDIATLLPFVVFLDLSSNKFSGVIPSSLANCSYMNALKLDQNQLSGQIPQQLGLLQRLKTFTVSNNLLTGPVPSFTNGHVMVNYSNNKGLCGGPSLRPCPKEASKKLLY
ncbi:inactive LRR receptor-like serine/threonine-protein kinase BIR2 [Abrus precatorius]|uniref:Inactive LRR receptor-like serine/threonine-protein kinase BIR2 n=1 Tax=Abrus precatorius TaxID=3816 RepID=A0A8B8K207_ABRPR|nr:inactive LRR receptor-like serine/threonine-protein kinase BIR2 [Abrus precatorius]